MTESQISRAKEMIETGYRISKMAERLKCSIEEIQAVFPELKHHKKTEDFADYLFSVADSKKSFAQIGREIGMSSKSVRTFYKMHGIKRDMDRLPEDPMPPQLCWTCKNACGGCSWSKSLKPVKGWDAKYVSREGYWDTYSISGCPEYIHDGSGK